MGSNATGKTTLGKALHEIMDLLQSGFARDFRKNISEESGSFSIDFVNDDFVLRRCEYHMQNARNHPFVSIREYRADIDKNDSYEMCVRKLKEYDLVDIDGKGAFLPFSDLKGQLHYHFSYPEINNELNIAGIKEAHLLKSLRAVIGTLDPSLNNVSVSKDLKNSFIIRRKNQEIIIQEGKLLNKEVLSSGTAEGVNVAVFLASMMENKPCFYYCDEHFSYIQSDIEKRIFGIMMSHIPDNGQLIFTTHNTDMLDLNLPKHSYVFLRKKEDNDQYRISAISASEVLKRNTDSIRSAVENDVFASLPEDSLLDELEAGWDGE